MAPLPVPAFDSGGADGMLGVGLATNILPLLVLVLDRVFVDGLLELEGARNDDDVGGPSWKRPILIKGFHSYYVVTILPIQLSRFIKSQQRASQSIKANSVTWIDCSIQNI